VINSQTPKFTNSPFGPEFGLLFVPEWTSPSGGVPVVACSEAIEKSTTERPAFVLAATAAGASRFFFVLEERNDI